MYLSELEIFGFKSFATKTKFKFAGGITALVGPNGCGKTNIVDAIRWVLGEQKTSVLRSENMEDVIFNGTAERKPLSMSEVSMVIENNREILASDYSTINVTRRLFRDGESNYFLNKNKCRLKDINDLFMDTGMGADSYSVIELKMVDAILKGKAEERRHLFEEAAGVTKYKQRRKEAFSKLQKVQLNLERVRDVVQVVEKNVNALQRQAQKTKRYNSLLIELRETELRLLRFEHFQFDSKLQIITRQLEEINKSKVDYEQHFNQLLEELNSQKQEQTEINSKYSLVIDEEKQSSSKISNIRRDIDVSKEKINSSRNSIQRLVYDLENNVGLIDGLSQDLDFVIKEVQEKKDSFSTIENQLQELTNEKQAALEKLKEAQSRLNENNQTIASLRSTIQTQRAIQSRSDSRRQSLFQRIEQYENDSERLNGQIGEILIQNDGINNEISEITAKLNTIQGQLQVDTERKNSLKSEIDQLKQDIFDEKNQISSKNASLQYLKSLIDSNEISKFLVSNKESWSQSVQTVQTLAEMLGVDDKFRVAIEASLGEAAHYVIVNTKDEAEAAFHQLIDKNKGKATFICRELISDFAAPKAIKKNDKIYGWASEIVRTDDKLKNSLRALSSHLLIVEDKETAKEVIESGLTQSAVTLKGEIITKSGLIRGGAVLKDEGVIVGKHERITKLEEEVVAIEEQLKSKEEILNNLNSEYNGIDLDGQINQAKMAENNIRGLEQKINFSKVKLENFNNVIISNSENIARLKGELSDLEKEENNLFSNISEQEEMLQSSISSTNDLQLALEHTQRDFDKVNEKYSDLDKNYSVVISEIKSGDSDAQRITKQIETEIARDKQRGEDKVNYESLIQDLEKHISGFEETLNQLQTEQEEILAKKEYLDQEKSRIIEIINSTSTEIENFRRNIDKSKEHIHKEELNLENINYRLNAIKEKAFQTYEIEIETYELVELAEDESKETAERIQDIKSKMDALGSINHAALEEYEEQSKQLNFQKNQINDLVESEKILKETIAEINQTAEKHFIETFEQVKENFKFLFSKLFNEEAYADIKLAEGNPLEADIEIIAKPPGKKPSSIDMLSGGEKTLTAIALLFGIYMVKPSPFCILDEVDAPLDDWNTDRFINMIKEFTDKTQFLIVTHNKKTMEAADTLYGITQQETGVSQIVSVRLNQTVSPNAPNETEVEKEDGDEEKSNSNILDT